MKDPLTKIQRSAVHAICPNTRFACKRLANQARRIIRELVLAR